MTARTVRLLTVGALLLGMTAPAAAADDEPIVWPTIRYGSPDKLSAGAAFQPRLPGKWDLLLGSVTLGMGGVKAGVGIGSFGDDIMGGYGIQMTVLRTSERPAGAAPYQTFLGVEAELMLVNISIKAGPAFRIGGRTRSPDRVRLNFSVGYGF